MSKKPLAPPVLYDELNFNNEIFVIDSAEKRLLCAVLKRAIEDFLCPERSVIHRDSISLKKHTIREAEVWLKNKHSNKTGSVRWVLEHISSDVDIAHNLIIKTINNEKTREFLKTNFLNNRVTRQVKPIKK